MELSKCSSHYGDPSVALVEKAENTNRETDCLALSTTCTFDSVRCLRAVHVGRIKS